MKSVKRPIDTSFWEDDMVIDRFTPEDKYFFLYLLTNPHTSQVGIYHLPYKIAAFELGYSVEAVKSLLQRFQDRYGVITYSKDHQEIAIMNALKHNIVKGGKPVIDCIKSELSRVKDVDLIVTVNDHLQDFWNSSSRKTDKVIQQVFAEQLGRRKEPKEENGNENDNENDNENERIVDDTSHDSSKAHRTDGLSVSQLESDFAVIWSKYPKKAGKKEAFNHYKAWRKASKDHTNAYLLHRLSLYLNHLANNSWLHPMNGSTWFNGRFDDDYSDNRNQIREQVRQQKETNFENQFFHNDSNPNPNPNDVSTDDLPF